METLTQYLKRLDDCIERNQYRQYEYDKETVEFLKQLRELQRPKQYHTCDDPSCIVCGSCLE